MPKKIAIALLIMRFTIGAFLGVWASLKFLRAEWMEKIFRDAYHIDFITQDHALAIDILQAIIVACFIIGLKRTISYGLVIAMHFTGVAVSTMSLINYTQFPGNLIWTAVPTLGAMIALFMLREYDIYTVDGWQDRAF